MTHVFVASVLVILYQTELMKAACYYYCNECYFRYNCNKCSDNSCSLCQSTCGSRTGCSRKDCQSCIDGFYLRESIIYHDYCEGCHNQNCKCKTYYDCDECLAGHYGENCVHSCPSDCQNSVCDKNDGTCSDGCVVGKYGTNCTFDCSQLCKNRLCHQADGKCTTGCINGYYLSSGSCYRCPEECTECASTNKCTACDSGYYKTGDNRCMSCQNRCRTCSAWRYCDDCVHTHYWGVYCQKTCTNCQTGCKSNGCPGSCVTGYYKQYNNDYYIKGYECKKCPDKCQSCTLSNACSTCKVGFWGTACQTACGPNCNGQNCSKSNGQCTNGCKNGFYGVDCSHSCLTACKTCSSGSNCDSCKQGYFHKDNNNQCDCRNDYCSHKSFGSCTQCKVIGWFPKQSGCCACSSDCKDSVCFTNGTCIECYNGKYGPYCEYICPTYCQNGVCKRDGSCYSCTDGYFGSKCDRQCTSEIWRCTKCLQNPDYSLICNDCTSGYYLKENKCTSCNANCAPGRTPLCNSTTGFCNHGCRPGWFGDRCDTKCRVPNCLTCATDSPDTCHTCLIGFYKMSEGQCISCPENCKPGTTCDRSNGSCIEGCEDTWAGEQCTEKCPSGCLKCEQFDADFCTTCKIGIYGTTCDRNCSTGCRIDSENQICNKSSGWCLYGCNEGLWGNNCDSVCGSGCHNSVCNRTSAICLHGCRQTHFGSLCNATCGIHCRPSSNGSSDRTCNETSGMCLFACKTGYYGDSCEGTCSENCKDGSCFRNNGSCSSGCTDGFTGSTCMEALRSEEPGSNVAAIGGGAVAGVAVLVIIAILVVVVVLRRRKKSSKMDNRDAGFSQKRPTAQQADPGPEYSNINEARIEKQETQIPGVTNLLYANAPVRMSDVSEKEEQINGNTITARPTSEDYLKEEEIDDDDIHVDESDEPDASGEADNTYYNIGGKRVAVAKLAEYINHKTQGELFNDFEKLPKGMLKSYKEAKKPKNATKNKYRAIYPYDENRVVLLDGGSDYMNASYIDGYNRSKEYIASSGPFQKSYDTTPDFWRMIWQERCATLVMLTNPVEKGQTKCEKYWSEAGESCKFGDIHITCLTEDPYADFTIRILAVTKDGESMNIRHVHFTAWPDKGIPHDITSMIELRQKVRSLHKDKDSPMIVHCSAGIGRTGTFIVLDMLTYEGEDRGSVDIFGSVAGLRYQRCNMVQTPEQYVYLHHAVLHSLTFDCRSIPGEMFLQTYNKLIERNGGERTIDKQFQQLQSITEEMTDEDRAQIEKNKALSNKNRKGADIPADETRVRLHESRKPCASDYINAVCINSFRKRRKFIVAQTPLPSAVVDFLSLIYQEKCTCVVSMEEPDIQVKTVKGYWPADNQVVKHGVFKVCCKDSKTTNHYVTKKLSITYHGPNGEESRDVNLFIFTNWPKDSPVPNTSDSLLDLVKTVDVRNRKSETEPPILIHCRTGAERSCLYCAVSVLIEKMEIEHEVSVVNTLRQIKARRILAMSSVDWLTA